MSFAIFTTSGFNIGRPSYQAGENTEGRALLERARAEGHVVVVVSTRISADAPTDQWWKPLVDHIFLASQDDIQHGWRAMCAFIGMPWPVDGLGEPEYWTTVQYLLESREGVFTRRDFISRLGETYGSSGRIR